MVYNNIVKELGGENTKLVCDISIDPINLKANVNNKVYVRCSEGSAGFNYSNNYCIYLNGELLVLGNERGKVTLTEWTLIWEEDAFVNYKNDGTQELQIKFGYKVADSVADQFTDGVRVVSETETTLPVISNSCFKKNGKWLSSYSWIKKKNKWKHCLIWKKINGVWKRGV